ncbi:hypothetical protein [Kitasatospora sp. NBC_00458]|uniref:hypothetical protein n=1 Tax=Kitasatospora sp. NBC_00458 TaxID=2903568 RepID=UPI002E18CB7F
MIKKITAVSALVGGLVLAGAGGAAAGSGAYHGHGGHDQKPVVGCAVGGDAGVANICGNTNVYSPNILGGLLDLIIQPPATGGGGGNNGGGNGGGGNN